MLSVRGRKPASVIVEPVARGFLKTGLTPNTVTVLSALATIVVAVTLIPTGHLLVAAILSALFTAFDMVDGTMARLRGGGSQFGATLDATCDRITDGVLFAAITWWLLYSYEGPRALIAASLVVMVGSQVISYVKARGEASNLQINGGLIERPERMIIGLLGLGLHGCGVPYAIDCAIWVLAVGSVVTVIQRLILASQSPMAGARAQAPAGAKSFPPSSQISKENLS